MLTARASPPHGRPLLGSSGLLRSVVSDRPRALLDVQAPNPTAVPRTVEGPGCCSREVDPLQSRHIPSAARRQRAGTGSHEVSRPFDDFTRASPHATGMSNPHRGAALRLSQPLSGLPAHPGFAALSHAAAVPGVLPSERCSSLGSRAPLGARLLPCGSPSQYLRCDARGLVLRVSPHSPGLRLARLGSPRSSDVVSGGLAPVFPDALDPAHRDHHVSCAVVRFEAFLPARVRARSHRLPGDREPLLSWAFRPSRAFVRPEPRALAYPTDRFRPSRS